jgi:CopG family nickel-responsive transcriptional regulator
VAIISISIPEDLAKELDRLQKDMGTGRSDVVRAGIRYVSQEQKQQLGERNSAVLMVTHQDRHDHEVAGIKSDYEDLIKTHLHNKIDVDRCVEVFMLEGPGDDIKAITNGFLANRKMGNVKLVVL